MQSLIIIVHVLSAVAIIGLVLIQHGKGADMGASFGSGASQTIFGSAGSGNALTKSTTWLAMVFFATSLGLAVFAKHQAAEGVQVESLLANPDAATVAPAPATALPAPATDKPAEAAAAVTQPATNQPANSDTAAPQQAAETPAATTKAVEPARQTKEN